VPLPASSQPQLTANISFGDVNLATGDDDDDDEMFGL
jgi:hypothetical protein